MVYEDSAMRVSYGQKLQKFKNSLLAQLLEPVHLRLAQIEVGKAGSKFSPPKESESGRVGGQLRVVAKS